MRSNKAAWERTQERHITSQRHAEWAARHILALLKTEDTEQNLVSKKELAKKMKELAVLYQVHPDHKAYMAELVLSQIED